MDPSLIGPPGECTVHYERDDLAVEVTLRGALSPQELILRAGGAATIAATGTSDYPDEFTVKYDTRPEN